MASLSVLFGQVSAHFWDRVLSITRKGVHVFVCVYVSVCLCLCVLAAVIAAYGWGWAEAEQRTEFLNPRTTVWLHSTVYHEGSGHTAALSSTKSSLPWSSSFYLNHKLDSLCRWCVG